MSHRYPMFKHETSQIGVRLLLPESIDVDKPTIHKKPEQVIQSLNYISV